MKRMYVVMLILVTVATAIVLIPSWVQSQKVTQNTVTGIPDDVMKIFQNSCMKCHSDSGSGMAKSMVNFSAWDTYNASKQAKKASAICKELKAGSMPPGAFKSENPDKVPTAAQVEAICKWADSVTAASKSK